MGEIERNRCLTCNATEEKGNRSERAFSYRGVREGKKGYCPREKKKAKGGRGRGGEKGGEAFLVIGQGEKERPLDGHQKEEGGSVTGGGERGGKKGIY